VVFELVTIGLRVLITCGVDPLWKLLHCGLFGEVHDITRKWWEDNMGGSLGRSGPKDQSIVKYG